MAYIGEKIGELKKQAVIAEQQNHPQEAAALWAKAAEMMKVFAMNCLAEETKVRRLHKVQEFNENSRRLAGQASDKPQSAGTGKINQKARSANSQRPDSNNEYRNLVQGLRFQANVTWDEIGGLEQVRDELDSFFGIFMANKPDGVKTDTFRNIMLFGPPGTGKTIIAAAISNQLDATFFNVKASDLLSKYYGESSRLINALYEVARSAADTGLSVIFIDEFDALCRQRQANSSGAEQQTLTTILSELDGLAEKNEDRGVLTLAATNRPDNLDHAIRSRFQRQFYIPLPDRQARADIFARILAVKQLQHNCALDELAELSRGFSGRDIEGVIRAAMSRMVTRANPDIRRLVRQGKEAINSYTLKVEPLTRDDFLPAIESISVDPADIAKSDRLYQSYANK